VAAGVKPLILVTVTVAITYFASLWIEKSIDEQKKKKLYLSAALVVVLGVLVITKLSKFGLGLSWVIVPLGVSYYTFSLIGYLVDVYAKKSKPEKNFLKLALYTLYFPKIMQGPISKFREIGPKLTEGHPLEYRNFCNGLQLILWGYFKKLVIVERTSMFTDNVFAGLGSFESGGLSLLIATFIATMGHYCDFSGYMDIVIGISQIMGIELEQNFNSPFFSRTAAEFWRRWHITLGVWFKDYVYMPLVINPRIIGLGKWFRMHVGKRAGKAVMSIIPLAVVWFLTGLWHGTGINYILWGCYWGLIIIISNVFEPEFKKLIKLLKIKTDSTDWHIFQTVRTFCFFVFGLLISTFIGFSNLKTYFRIIFKDFGIGRFSFDVFSRYGLNQTNFIILAFAIVILWTAEAIHLHGSVREKIAGLNAIPRWVIYSTAFLIVMLLGVYGPGYTTKGFAYALF